MTIEIRVGPELDRAVAEATGDPHFRAHDWEHTGLGGYDTFFFRCTRCGDFEADDQFGPPCTLKDRCLAHYSTDLNAAFAAAEKAGLFKQYGYCEVSGQHVISKTVSVKSWADTIAHEATPALAICAAILKLKG